MTFVWRGDICRCRRRPTGHSGAKPPWPETSRGTAHQTNPAPTSFVRNLSNASTFGIITIARELIRKLLLRQLIVLYLYKHRNRITNLVSNFCTFYSCGEGRIMTPDRKGCVDKNECLDSPCRNGGVCLNQDPRIRYRCICPDGFWGENCELVQEGQKLKLGMGALAAILVCLLIILSKCYCDPSLTITPR